MAGPIAEAVLHATDEHRAIEVRAILQDGLIRDTHYSVDFAGLLHSRFRLLSGKTVGDESMIDDPVNYALPLARCTTPEGWLWCASAEIVAQETPTDARSFRRTDNVGWNMQHSRRPIPEYVHSMAGPFRDVVIPLPAAATHEASWRCVGDPDMVQKALSTVFNVGKRRNSGEGKVLDWDVRVRDDVADLLRWSFIDNGRIIRPCPPSLAEGIAFSLDWHSARPPSWNPESMMQLAVTHVDNTQSV